MKHLGGKLDFNLLKYNNVWQALNKYNIIFCIMPELTNEEKLSQQKEQCIFCQVISGQKPALKVYEDNKVVAILDIGPANKGHVLLMPKEHYSIMPLMPEDLIRHIFKISKGISQALLKAMLVSGTNLFIANGGIAGQQIPHFVVHIIPREKEDGVDIFDLRRINVDTNVMLELQKALQGNLHLKLQDKLAEQGLLKEAEISEEELINMIKSNLQLRDFLLKNIENLETVVNANPQLEMMFRGKNVARIKEVILSSGEDKQLEAVGNLLKGKKVNRKEERAEILKEIETGATEETSEEKALREKLSVKKNEERVKKAKFKKKGNDSEEPENNDGESKFKNSDDASGESDSIDEESETDLDDIANLLSGGNA